MVTWYWWADTLFWQLSINHSMDVQYQRCTYGNGATLLFFKVWGLACGRTDVWTYIRTVTWHPNSFNDNDRWVTEFCKITLRCYPGLYLPVLFQDVKRALICMFKCSRCHGGSCLSRDSHCYWVRIWPTAGAVGLTLKLYHIKKS